MGCLFMIVAACFAHQMAVVYYLIIFAVIMLIGSLFSKVKTNGSVSKNK